MTPRVLTAREVEKTAQAAAIGWDANLAATLRAYAAVVEQSPKVLAWLKWWSDPHSNQKPAPLGTDDLDDTVKAFESALAAIPEDPA